MGGFTVSGHLFDNNNTVEIEFGETTKICKIVELNADGTVKEEHLYASIQAAVEDGSAHYDAYKVTEDGAGYEQASGTLLKRLGPGAAKP